MGKVRSRRGVRAAVMASVESVEPRRLLAALAPSSPVLVFNDDLTSGSPSHTDTLTITNTGSTTLTFPGGGGFTVVRDPSAAADQSADFHVTNASLPTSLAPGAAAQISVNFTATVANTIESALLQINSSDPAGPTNVPLHGLGTNGQFGYNEPSLANILTAFDIPTNIGVTDPSNSQYPLAPAASSQEMALQTMKKAGSGPVTIQMLASFNASAEPSLRLGYYTPGEASATTELFTINNADDQTVNPVPQGTTSFDPGTSPFGLYANFPGISATDTHYSEDALNAPLDAANPHKFRFFPLENADGSAVPNAYVLAAEDYNGTAYHSFTNAVAIIRNVEPASAASTTTSSFGGKQVATYTDAAGHKVTLKLAGPGTGQATFDQGNANPTSITLANTTAASTFTIIVAGGTTSVGSIDVTGSLARLSAKTTQLQGDLTIGGSLGTAQLAGAMGGHALSVGSGRIANLSLGQVADLSLNSAGPIGTLQATSWMASGGADVIMAPSIARLTVSDVFAPSIDLTGAGTDLGSASIGSAIGSGSWTIAGTAGAIRAASVVPGWTGTFGAVGTFSTSGDFAGTLNAGRISAIRVGGTIMGGQVRATGNIGTVTAGALVDADVFAGVDPAVTQLPASSSAFVANSTITSVTVTGRNDPFAVQGSNVAASSLGRITFGAVNTNNGSVPFGLAAHQLASYTRKVNGKVLTWTRAKSPSLLTPDGDAVARLL
jgi:hypothetical protein